MMASDRLISRNRKSFNDDYPVLIDSLKSLKPKSFTIDGEITALDENGRSSFQLLQGYEIFGVFRSGLRDIDGPEALSGRCLQFRATDAAAWHLS